MEAVREYSDRLHREIAGLSQTNDKLQKENYQLKQQSLDGPAGFSSLPAGNAAACFERLLSENKYLKIQLQKSTRSEARLEARLTHLSKEYDNLYTHCETLSPIMPPALHASALLNKELRESNFSPKAGTSEKYSTHSIDGTSKHEDWWDIEKGAELLGFRGQQFLVHERNLKRILSLLQSLLCILADRDTRNDGEGYGNKTNSRLVQTLRQQNSELLLRCSSIQNDFVELKSKMLFDNDKKEVSDWCPQPRELLKRISDLVTANEVLTQELQIQRQTQHTSSDKDSFYSQVIEILTAVQSAVIAMVEPNSCSRQLLVADDKFSKRDMSPTQQTSLAMVQLATEKLIQESGRSSSYDTRVKHLENEVKQLRVGKSQNRSLGQVNSDDISTSAMINHHPSQITPYSSTYPGFSS